MVLPKWFSSSVYQEITFLVGIIKLNFLENLFEYPKVVTNMLN